MRTLGLGLLCVGIFFSMNLRAEDGGHEAGGGHAPKHGANLHLFPAHSAQKEKATAPGAVNLQGPAALSKVPASGATLKWEAATGADSYHLQVATDPNFKWLVVNETFYKGISYDLKGLEAGKQYFWRVAGMNGANDAEYIKGAFARSSFQAQ